MSESFSTLLDKNLSTLDMQPGSIVSGVVLDVDKDWIDNFNLVFNTEDENHAETLAMIEVKQNLHDYITVYVDLEDEEEDENK